jgi:hypothetical protein
MSKKRNEPEPFTKPEPPPVHSEDQDVIKSLLFAQVERPRGLTDVRIVNVFDNRYRINLWVKLEENGLEKQKIAASYFARYDGETLEIRA